MTTLTAYLSGLRVGVFTDEGAGDDYRFIYDDAWRRQSGRQVMSFSMPKTRAEHQGPEVRNFLQGFLPDDSRVTKRWSTQLHTANTPLGLLSKVGLDVAGALQLSPMDEEVLAVPGGLDRISDRDIEAHLLALRGDPAGWTLPTEHTGYFSLAGYQSKFALRKTGSGWAVPWGSEPSTHIIKPGITGLPSQGVVEHLTQKAAATLGLRAAQTPVEMFGDIPALVVERYDRLVSTDGVVSRLHQEDFMQALGLDPNDKYQSEGGPGVPEVSSLIADSLRPGRPVRNAVNEFLVANAFHWVTVGTDAHAKNYSFLHTPHGSSLAPLYDAASALPYEDLPNMHPRNVILAMKVGDDYRVQSAEPRHLQRLAEAAGADPDFIMTRAREMAEQLPDAISDGIRELEGMPLDFDRLNRFVDAAGRRSAALIKKLDAAAADGYSSPKGKKSSSSLAQQRGAGAQGREPKGTPHGGRFSTNRRPDADDVHL